MAGANEFDPYKHSPPTEIAGILVRALGYAEALVDSEGRGQLR